MSVARPGHHGQARFTPKPFEADLENEARRWDVEEAAFELYGAEPLRSFYEHGHWNVMYVPTVDTAHWFVETFGRCDVAILQATAADGADVVDGIGFDRVK